MGVIGVLPRNGSIVTMKTWMRQSEMLAESVYFGGAKREEAAGDPADGGTHFHDIDDGDGTLPF